jgi:hypothetical protein
VLTILSSIFAPEDYYIISAFVKVLYMLIKIVKSYIVQLLQGVHCKIKITDIVLIPVIIVFYITVFKLYYY